MKKLLIIASAFSFTVAAAQNHNKNFFTMSTNNSNDKLVFESVYSIFITKKLKESKAFYMKWFDMNIVFESTWFILLATTGDKPFYVAFMDEKHPSSPPSSPAMTAKSGVCLTLQVTDAETVYNKLVKKGIQISYALKTEDWGQKRFGIIDPNGMYIDIVQQIEPKKGYWDQYMPK